MTRTPFCISDDLSAIEALTIMNEKQFTVLLVANPDNTLQGIVKMSDIIKLGLSL